MIKAGDKIKLKKAICVLGEKFVGTEFTVTSVDEKYIYFRSGSGAGGIGHADFEEHFEIVGVNEANKEAETKVETKVEVTKESKPTLKYRLTNFFRGRK